MNLGQEYAAIFGTSVAGDTLPAVQTIVFLPADRPDVEVHVDGIWCPGELRAWTQRPDGSWWGNVQWRREPGATFLDTYPADRIRQALG